ncbi:GntR family transcriptional repressor for pyruvate dehydrogenase complex [Sedimentibacter acidaminivorans]|jgi:GntR family transcriptional regulator, transcriptional repressor for pyruvate dehydrogenase complex|uniref:GntR family transcriptional repressor for pyruvate dehydrogenase complex n=1 Tax=Sedimentibacter acidaminivorans TaxID=913099 RepID=A0ABS4GH02_9FIRM|nr:FadR/GntR family transcriptional regulator [Sedimentibacter acidaminivorans]MBP1926969.1 GntR family transcriptional repressor for pyruvate dehydrogenase complex [Sedimentibacter acidaminivorans]
MFESIENKKISQVVIEQIQDMIMSGELKNGDKLPPERELTQTLNIGRPALREALKALEVIGLIESRHGQGNFIVNNTENSFFKPLSLSFKLSNGNIEDILELRHLLENYTVSQAAIHASEEDIQRLYELYESLVNSETLELKSHYDKEFHYEIAKISKNTLINNLLESTSYLFDNFISKTIGMTFSSEDSIDSLYEEHLNIIRAIEKHDPDKASKCIFLHLNKINRGMLIQ